MVTGSIGGGPFGPLAAWIDAAKAVADKYEHFIAATGTGLTAIGTLATFIAAIATLRTVREMRAERFQSVRPLLQLTSQQRNLKGSFTRRGVLLLGHRGPRPSIFTIRNDGLGPALDLNLQFHVHASGPRRHFLAPQPPVVEWELPEKAGHLRGLRFGKNNWEYRWQVGGASQAWATGLSPNVEWENLPIVPPAASVPVTLSSNYIARACACGIAEAVEKGYGFVVIQVEGSFLSAAGERQTFRENVALRVIKVRVQKTHIRFLLEVRGHVPASRRSDAMNAYLMREDEVKWRKWPGGTMAYRTIRGAQQLGANIKVERRMRKLRKSAATQVSHAQSKGEY